MEVRSVKVRVPGTSANCGPGFDCLGVACTIYNELELTLLEEERLDIEITGDGAENIPVDERNIVWRSIQKLLERAGKAQEYKGAIIRMDNGVPLSRGLGSSATAIVGGLKAANECLGNPFTNRDLLQMATEIEGHPDNVAPAIFGGFTISIVRNGKPECFSLMPKLPLKLVVTVPDFFLPTKAARAVLPAEVPMKDAVFNIGRAAMLTAALCKGNKSFLRSVFDDALHQPYRAKLIPGMYDVFKAARAAGALGASMSGAGPCLIAFTVENADAVGMAMRDAFAKNNVKSQYHVFDIDGTGATVI
ncbi:MAG: homoserine kinase [Anaerovibrio sp.]|uniref:Homoserine kinase n=1 Tax=Anaerovibrio slackiae TaxID=2652309 RepID=A0A6I2UH87_9FIRM|nr:MULTISPECIES: homoserine kinase [Anaerovibrio]MBQ5847018.1 homoserine kinase [Selenomonadaceae bacterium]MCI6097217.1 homoserine kinase [Selenomonadaceae bacterium]MCI6483504.1 homoserine kinase [Selenomonadaceae bacterium]MDD6163365.1 homoserine kinase [Anaerovibrio slackiae]MEE1308368.1 homoserine kinase [Anaerovibrio sp.]